MLYLTYPTTALGVVCFFFVFFTLWRYVLRMAMCTIFPICVFGFTVAPGRGCPREGDGFFLFFLCGGFMIFLLHPVEVLDLGRVSLSFVRGEGCVLTSYVTNFCPCQPTVIVYQFCHCLPIFVSPLGHGYPEIPHFLP